jgi:hypothetical protein
MRGVDSLKLVGMEGAGYGDSHTLGRLQQESEVCGPIFIDTSKTK